MLSKLLFASFLSVGLSISTPDSDGPLTDCESEHHKSFELPSYENLIDSPEFPSDEIYMIDLPEVEIFATYTGDEKCETTAIDLLPVINLPEVEIFATYPCRKKHQVMVKDGEVIPVINLEPVIITPEEEV